MTFQKKVFEILERRNSPGRPALLFQVFLGTVILSSAALSIWETVPENDVETFRLLAYFQDFCGVFFLVEYLARMWVAPMHSPGKSALESRLRAFFRPTMLIDLLVVLPFVLPYAFSFDITSLRILRLVRIMRIAKLGRFSKSIVSLAKVLRRSAPELLVSLTLSFLLLIVAATGIYHFERSAQPQTFASIPQSIWWAVNALTGIWYGDVYPITLGGKIFAALISILGVGTIALPAGIIASGILDSVEQNKKQPANALCPNCHEPLIETKDAA